jgi:hypothetical protein
VGVGVGVGVGSTVGLRRLGRAVRGRGRDDLGGGGCVVDDGGVEGGVCGHCKEGLECSGRARLDLSTLIARYELYKLERQRCGCEASGRKQLSYRRGWRGTRRARGECGSRRDDRGCSSTLWGTVWTSRDDGGRRRRASERREDGRG